MPGSAHATCSQLLVIKIPKAKPHVTLNSLQSTTHQQSMVCASTNSPEPARISRNGRKRRKEQEERHKNFQEISRGTHPQGPGPIQEQGKEWKERKLEKRRLETPRVATLAWLVTKGYDVSHRLLPNYNLRKHQIRQIPSNHGNISYVFCILSPTNIGMQH